jgi:UDP-N-acetylmuramoyl-tripeptide--D-alanyl-D-alanine ligase
LRLRVFVAITGSLGTTTAKECLAGILASHGRTYRTFRNQNGLPFVVLNILRVWPWHRYAVLELGAGTPGCMEKPARLLKPDVALILMVGTSHLVQYGERDAIAADKEQVVRALRRGGTAVLNRDDARVAAMAGRTGARVVYFGTSPDADVQTRVVSACWNRLCRKTIICDICWELAVSASERSRATAALPLSPTE